MPLTRVMLPLLLAAAAHADMFVISGQITSSTHPSFLIGELIHGSLLTDTVCTVCSVPHFDFSSGGDTGGGLLDFQLQIGIVSSADKRGAYDSDRYTTLDRANLTLTGTVSGGFCCTFIGLYPGGFDMYPGENLTAGGTFFQGGEVRGNLTIVPTPEPSSIWLLGLAALAARAGVFRLNRRRY